MRSLTARVLRAARGAELLPAVILPVSVFAAFAPALDAGFVNWDDEPLLVHNVLYRGLGLAELRWMVTAAPLGHWAPLTWVTYAVDYLVWGTDPLGYHLTNLALHAAAAVAFYYLSLRLLASASRVASNRGLRLGALVSALVFAVHPLRAESVVWVSERRDVLSGLFFLLTLVAYLKAADGGGRRLRWLSLSVIAYGLAVASKTIVMTLPAVLLVLDVYPLRRLAHPRWARLARSERFVWLEKVPFVLLAMVAAGMAVWGQREFVAPLESRPLAGRLAVASYGLSFYVLKWLAPYPISPLYEIPPGFGWSQTPVLASAAAVAGATAVFVLVRRRWPAGLAAWVCYVVLLAPVVGLTQAGPQLVAARYSYLSCLGWALLAGAGVSILSARLDVRSERDWARPVGTAAVGAVVVLLAALAWQQARIWHDSGTLWTHALALDPGSPIAHNNLGSHLIVSGRLDAGERHVKRALELRPGYEDAVRNLGVLALLGQLDDGERSAVGLQLVNQRDFDRAVELFRHAVDADPNSADAHNNLGVALFFRGDRAAAVAAFERALALKPGFEEARLNLEAARGRR